MDIHSIATSVRIAFGPVVRLMAIVSGVLFLLCAFYVVGDMLARNVLHMASRASNEISTYVLAAGVAWSLAYALRTGGHVRIDVVFAALPNKARNALDVVATVIMALFAFALSYYSWDLVFTSFVSGTKSLTSLQAPLYIPQSIMALGFTTLLIEALLLMAVQAAWIAKTRSLDSAADTRSET